MGLIRKKKHKPNKAASRRIRRLVSGTRRLALKPITLPVRAMVGTLRVVPGAVRGTYKYVLRPPGRAISFTGRKILWPSAQFAGKEIIWPASSEVVRTVWGAGKGVVGAGFEAGKGVVSTMWKTPAGRWALGGAALFFVPGVGQLLFSKLGAGLAVGLLTKKGWEVANVKWQMKDAEATGRLGRLYYGVKTIGGDELTGEGGQRFLVTLDPKTGEVSHSPFDSPEAESEPLPLPT
ncbi:MAG: hypothetical protein ABIH20_03915 [Candidatus Diapherotrites archaeon]